MKIVERSESSRKKWWLVTFRLWRCFYYVMSGWQNRWWMEYFGGKYNYSEWCWHMITLQPLQHWTGDWRLKTTPQKLKDPLQHQLHCFNEHNVVRPMKLKKKTLQILILDIILCTKSWRIHYISCIDSAHHEHNVLVQLKCRFFLHNSRVQIAIEAFRIFCQVKSCVEHTHFAN